MLQQVSRLLVDKNRHANATALALATLKSGAVAEERKSIESGWACRALMGEAGERRRKREGEDERCKNIYILTKY